MLTPRFKLSQDNNHVYINVHAPYTNIGDTEIEVDGENFLFVSNPYFLRLRLPGRIVENDSAKGSYLCDSGDFNFILDKETAGEQFENLDMITSLLAPADIPDMNPDLVEMLENEITVENELTVENGHNEDNVFSNNYTYGFANKLTTEFSSIGIEFPQVFELRAPETVSIEERHNKRVQHEDGKFSADHYLADFYDDELIEPYLTAVAPWCEQNFNKEFEFSVEEVDVLKELPNKHYLLSATEYKQVLYGLVDILYGYCYDKRTTMNESTVESGWTINKLSSTLSWFCTFNDVREVLTSSYRRALIYPIFRNFKLCIKVKNDLVALFRNGKKFVLKCMIEIYQIFNASNDARYILNQIYIKDYLIFLQKCRNEELDELYNNIVNIGISKNDLQLDLQELEAAAEIVKLQEGDSIMENEVAVRMASMSLLTGLNRTNQIYIDDESDDETDSSDSDEVSSDELDSDDDPS